MLFSKVFDTAGNSGAEVWGRGVCECVCVCVCVCVRAGEGGGATITDRYVHQSVECQYKSQFLVAEGNCMTWY